jgi:polyhydroxyalkanoate synthesis regulator phasin
MAEPADSAAGSLRELAERLLGRPVDSSERTRELLDDLVERGRLDRDDANALLGELRKPAGPVHRMGERAGDALTGLADHLGVVRTRQLEELELRVAQLEHRVRLLERLADGSGVDSPPSP